MNIEMDRRESIKAIALGGIAMTTFGAWAKDNEPKIKKLDFQTNEIKPRPLSFNPKKLNGISEKLIVSHWKNNYVGSVKALNGVNKKLKEAFANKDTASFIIGGLKREQLFRTGSVVNHDLYFENLGGDGKINGEIKKVVTKIFLSESSWEDDFRRTAKTLGGGSGWVVLGYNYHLKTLENYWCFDHMHAPAGTIPLLMMDMYEHSYQMDYGAAAGKYIDAFLKNINWEVVNSRLERAKLFV